jgi:hypothetical protein
MSKQYYVVSGSRYTYSIWRFLFDVFMVCITGGLWLIWIIIRMMVRF